MRPSILLLLASLGIFHAPATAAPGKLNIVVFLTDDQSQLDGSPYGGQGIRTPNMQRLADAGHDVHPRLCGVAKLRAKPRGAAHRPHARPQRRGSQSLQAARGVEEVAGVFPGTRLRSRRVWQGFALPAHGGLRFRSLRQRRLPRARGHHERRCVVEEPQARRRQAALPDDWQQLAARPLAEETTRIRSRETPAARRAAWTRPATRPWRARYAAAVTRADADLGLVLEAVQTCLPKETLFLFSSDHGAQWPFGKWNLYESGVATPLIVVWPGVVKPAARTDAMVQWIDFLPTLLEAAGGTPAAILTAVPSFPCCAARPPAPRAGLHHARQRQPVQRLSRTRRARRALEIHPQPASRVCLHHAHRPRGRRAGPAGLLLDLGNRRARPIPQAAAILKRYHARPAEELYDLASDPTEQSNLAGEPRHGARLAALRAELDAWMKTQGDRQPVLPKPRLLSDPTSYGPKAEITGSGKSASKQKAKK